MWISVWTSGTDTTYSSAMGSVYSAHTSSMFAGTRQWEPPGATWISHRSAVRKPGRTRQRVTLKRLPTNGGTGMTATRPALRLTRSGLKYPPPAKQRSESATQKRKRDRELLMNIVDLGE